MGRLKDEGRYNQELLKRHRHVDVWRSSLAIRRPACAGEPDLVFFDARTATLYVVEGCRRGPVGPKEIDQLGGYWSWFSGATPEMILLSFKRSVTPGERKRERAVKQNQAHLRKHRNEESYIENDLRCLKDLRKLRMVVPVLVVYECKTTLPEKKLRDLAFRRRKLGLPKIRLMCFDLRWKLIEDRILK